MATDLEIFFIISIELPYFSMALSANFMYWTVDFPCTRAAHLLATSLHLGLSSGILIAVPIPKESELFAKSIEEAIQASLA